MALGNMNIRSQKQVDNFDPDMTEITLDASNANKAITKYGRRARHRSMWCKDFIEKGLAAGGSAMSSDEPKKRKSFDSTSKKCKKPRKECESDEEVNRIVNLVDRL